jgi:hypothetical protein
VTHTALWLGACVAPDAHVPPFARIPYQPFSRAAALAVAALGKPLGR